MNLLSVLCLSTLQNSKPIHPETCNLKFSQLFEKAFGGGPPASSLTAPKSAPAAWSTFRMKSIKVAILKDMEVCCEMSGRNDEDLWAL